MNGAWKADKISRAETNGVELRVGIHSRTDIVAARLKGREVATRLGFSGSEVTLITAAISEIAHNIVEYAKQGEIVINPIQQGKRGGICIVARDEGPGITDVEEAMQYGFSTCQKAGAGLPGAKWLMDEFQIDSKPGQGTVITMKKWLS